MFEWIGSLQLPTTTKLKVYFTVLSDWSWLSYRANLLLLQRSSLSGLHMWAQRVQIPFTVAECPARWPSSNVVCLPPLARVHGSLWHSQSPPPTQPQLNSSAVGGRAWLQPMLPFSLWWIEKFFLSKAAEKKEQKICPWLDKRLTLCHVRSHFNKQTGSVTFVVGTVSVNCGPASLRPPPPLLLKRHAYQSFTLPPLNLLNWPPLLLHNCYILFHFEPPSWS